MVDAAKTIRLYLGKLLKHGANSPHSQIEEIIKEFEKDPSTNAYRKLQDFYGNQEIDRCFSLIEQPAKKYYEGYGSKLTFER